MHRLVGFEIVEFTSTVGELILRSASRLKQKIFYGKTRGLGLQQLPDHTGRITGIKWLYRIINLSFLLLLSFTLWLLLSSSTQQEMSQIVNY